MRAWRDYRCSHEPPTPKEVSRAFAKYGTVERLVEGYEEIRCVKF